MATLSVAVVGSGPAGLYTAEALVKQAAALDPPCQVAVDVLDRLPTPYGLVRYGVAPDHPSIKSIAEYLPLLERVRAGMVEQNGNQPGDPQRGVRAVLSAMAQDPPPRRLVLGGEGFDTSVASLEDTLADIRANEALSRGSDFPPGG